MSYDPCNVVEGLTEKLESLGFTFHEGEDDNAPECGLDGAWSCWRGPDNRWDVECTETRNDPLPPLLDALDAYVEYMTTARAGYLHAIATVLHLHRDGTFAESELVRGMADDLERATEFDDLPDPNDPPPNQQGSHIIPPDPVPVLLAALRRAKDAMSEVSNEVAYGDQYVDGALDAIHAALKETGLQLPQPEKIIVQGREYDYLTCEWRHGQACVHGWSTYPENSVLAGQPMKVWLDSFATMGEALAKYPSAAASSPLLQPQVSLNHLPDEGDH